MGPNIIPEYRKQFDFNPNDQPKGYWAKQVEDKRQADILSIIGMPPILARGVYDYLIQMRSESDPPTLEWKIDLLNGLDPYGASTTKSHMERRLEYQTKTY